MIRESDVENHQVRRLGLEKLEGFGGRCRLPAPVARAFDPASFKPLHRRLVVDHENIQIRLQIMSGRLRASLRRAATEAVALRQASR